MKSRRLTVALCWMVLMSVSVGGAETAEEVLENMRETYESIEDAKIRFTQRVRFSLANIEQEVRGQLTMKRENRYRVELEDRTIVTDGKTVWSYSRPNNQVLIDDFAMDDRSFSPENILVQAPSEFVPTLLGQERIRDVEFTVIKLVPRDEQAFMQSMKVWVDPDSWLMGKVELVDANGKETTYVVEEIRINTDVDDKLFRFRIPDGVDVVDLR